MTSLEDARRAVLDDFSVEERRRLTEDKEAAGNVEFQGIPADLKVSCRFSGDGGCRSPSKRDPTRSKAWVCGSNFSHNERLNCCVAYCRLNAGVHDRLALRDRRRC